MNMCMCIYFFNPKDYCLNTLQPFIPHTIVALLLLFEMDKSQNWPGFDWFKIIYLFIRLLVLYILGFFQTCLSRISRQYFWGEEGSLVLFFQFHKSSLDDVLMHVVASFFFFLS